MSTPLFPFVRDILKYAGAAVEVVNEDLMEAVLPPQAAKTLGCPEFTYFSFSSSSSVSDPSEESIVLSYESEVLKNFEALLGKEGYFSRFFIDGTSVSLEKLEKSIPSRVILNNAVFKVEKCERAFLTFLVIVSRYTALSDEKKEGLISSCMNESTLSSVFFDDLIDVCLRKAESATKEVRQDKNIKILSRQNLDRVLSATYTAQMAKLQEELQDHIRSLERRMRRDVHRVHDYYSALLEESKKIHEKKKARDALPSQENDKFMHKLRSIEIERKWKIQDTVSKYALSLEIIPAAAIRIETHVPVFTICIRRRKNSRLLALAYNPLIQSLEFPPCEICFHPKIPYWICDDALHIVCNQCSLPCKGCEKVYCRTCHSRCPKCEKSAQGV